MEKNEYYLGLDIGTSSIGFAVTDKDYNVIKKGKKFFWGVRLFEEGKTAEERRISRTNRRRLQRRKDRMKLLQSLFMNEINKIDSLFFMRLNESMYHFDDRSDGIGMHTLFDDKNYTDKNFHQKYRTFYHLRKDLLEGKVSDVRLLYLGIAHIIKNRGHFLFEGENLSAVSDFSNVFKVLEVYIDENNLSSSFAFSDMTKLEGILKENTLSLRDKERKITELFIEKPSTFDKTLVKLMLGMTADVAKLFDVEENETLQKKKVNFRGNFEEEALELQQLLGDDFTLIELVKSIYDWALLSNILSGNPFISYAKVDLYNEHKADLKKLKEFVKKYIPNKYQEIFVQEDLNTNYPAYIGMTKKNGKKQVVKNNKCSQEDFCSFLAKQINKLEVSDDYLSLVEKIEQKTLLPKAISKDNGVIPYQVHQAELQKILEVNANKFPFLNESDGDFTILQKIDLLLKYRIPYYVGPLNNNSKYSWVVKNLKGKITPWNFDKVVNKEVSAENFILRLTNKCTYLKDEFVLPKNSLLYSKYMVLNELNNLKINGDEISITLKKELYESLFKHKLKVTLTDIERHLIKSCKAEKGLTLTGVDKDFKANLKSYQDFVGIFDEEYVKQHEGMIEDIIRWITLFSQSKEMVIHKIRDNYPNISDEQLKKIKSLSYTGWGRFSKKFLMDIQGANKETGEVSSIITALLETNNNLMQLLSNSYTYLDKIKETNKIEYGTKVEPKDIEALYCSPAVKKAIWQAVQIVYEVEKTMKGKPSKLFIEVAREDGEKLRTTSRHKALLATYQSIKNEYQDVYEELKDKDDKRLQSKKLYLYFMQLGRCAYTGERIDIDKLSNQNLYDIDHIYPRSKTKDDSLHNNLVLVTKKANSEKGDTYPIPEKFRQENLWKLWVKDKKNKLITQEKYDRLIRRTSFSDKELEGFIARSLVETRQSTKAVAEIFENYYKNEKSSKVVYVKAGNISTFRQHFDIVKVRELNDYHHAHDAYLSVVVGNVFSTKFTDNFYKNISTATYSLRPEAFYSRDVSKGDYFAWKGDGTSISKVKEVLTNNKILFTRQARKVSGALFDATIYKKGEGEFAVKNPTNQQEQRYKLTNLEKYGGFKKVKGAYFCVVEHEEKKKTVRSIEYIPIYVSSQIKENSDLITYLENRKDEPLKKVKVIKKVMQVDSLVNIDGFPMHISGRQGKQIILKGAVQLQVSKEKEKYIKYILNIKNNYKKSENYKISDSAYSEYEKLFSKGRNFREAITEKNIELYDLFTLKLKESIYAKRLSTQGLTLEKQRNVFIKLALEEQCVALINMLSFFKCNASKTDLKLIGGSANCGTLLIGKNITKCQKVELINQSITGIYEKKVNLLG